MCFPNPDERALVLSRTRNGGEITREDVYQKTQNISDFLRRNGHTVIERWEHELPRPWWNDRCPPKRNETYPHAIVYDFESYQDKTKASQPTRDLSYESEHVSISVSIADTLNPEPEYIVSRDPNELLRLFYLALERRSDAIREDIAQKYRPPDVEGLSEAQRKLIDQWCDQVPVLGFNSGHYDMKLIRKYFVMHLAQENGVLAAEKEGRVMFSKTPRYNFLDIMNYMAPDTTYDKWVKTYGAKPGQTGLSRPPVLLVLVLTTQKRFRSIPRGVRGLQASLPRARDKDFRRLAGVLQQSGRVSFSRGLGEDAGLLNGLGSRHLQRRSLLAGSVDAIHLAGHFEGAQCTRAIRPWARSIRHNGSCSRRFQFGVHAQARGRPDPNPLPQIRRSPYHEADSGL